MRNKVLYTSDMHGNEKQFKTFVDYALQTKPEIVIVGGELLPKGYSKITDDYPRMQRIFAAERLPKLLRPIKQNIPLTQVYVIPGNDDCLVNDDILNSNNDGIFTNIDGKRLPLPNGLEILGCSLVPFTPFAIKDREVFDENETYNGRENYFQGIISVARGSKFEWSRVQITEAHRGQDLLNVLETIPFAQNYVKTVYVLHTPPMNTPLDVIYADHHVGSSAVRRFIEKYQPYLTLHGHIHETVEMSGEFKTKIGNTWCLSSGNDNEDNKLAVLTFDLDNPAEAQRIKLPCSFFGKTISKLFKR